jgi:hypothetical protein
MMKTEKQTRSAVWLRLHGYRVDVLKPEFRDKVIELERTIREGVTAYPDSSRTDFYDVALDDGWTYIHIDRARQTVYLVAHFLSAFNSLLSINILGSSGWHAST